MAMNGDVKAMHSITQRLGKLDQHQLAAVTKALVTVPDMSPFALSEAAKIATLVARVTNRDERTGVLAWLLAKCENVQRGVGAIEES